VGVREDHECGHRRKWWLKGNIRVVHETLKKKKQQAWGKVKLGLTFDDGGCKLTGNYAKKNCLLPHIKKGSGP